MFKKLIIAATLIVILGVSFLSILLAGEKRLNISDSALVHRTIIKVCDSPYDESWVDTKDIIGIYKETKLYKKGTKYYDKDGNQKEYTEDTYFYTVHFNGTDIEVTYPSEEEANKFIEMIINRETN